MSIYLFATAHLQNHPIEASKWNGWKVICFFNQEVFKKPQNECYFEHFTVREGPGNIKVCRLIALIDWW